MSGILATFVGSGGWYTATMTVETIVTTGKASLSYAGFIDPTSRAAYLPGGIGALIPRGYKTARFMALHWQSGGGFSGTGTVFIEITGDRAEGFIGQVQVNDVNVGGIPASPIYTSATDTSLFTVATGVLNPFGTSGTKTIRVM